MKIKTMTYDEFHEFTNIDEYSDEEYDELEEQTLVEHDDFGEKCFVLLYGPAYRLTDKNIIIASGVFCQYCEDTDSSEPDWDICLIYENVENDEDFDPSNYLYFEQGVEESAIANFEHYRNG